MKVKEIVIIKTDGTEERKIIIGKITLEHQQKIVGGYIEHVPVVYNGKKKTMVVNEKGKLDNLPVNAEASKIYGGKIVGNVFIM